MCILLWFLDLLESCKNIVCLFDYLLTLNFLSTDLTFANIWNEWSKTHTKAANDVQVIKEFKLKKLMNAYLAKMKPTDTNKIILLHFPDHFQIVTFYMQKQFIELTDHFQPRFYPP